MQRTSEEIMEMLNKLAYQQQVGRQIFDILESYPSLIDDLEKFIDAGATSIGMKTKHYIDKPFMVQVEDEVHLYVNV